MEHKYRPDGWLGLICASKLYVDFTKSDFDEVFQKLIAQIQLHQRKQSLLPSTTKHEEKQSSIPGHEMVSMAKAPKNSSQPLVGMLFFSIRREIPFDLGKNVERRAQLYFSMP